MLHPAPAPGLCRAGAGGDSRCVSIGPGIAQLPPTLPIMPKTGTGGLLNPENDPTGQSEGGA